MFTTIVQQRSFVLTAAFCLFLGAGTANAQHGKSSHSSHAAVNHGNHSPGWHIPGRVVPGRVHYSRDFRGWSRSCYFPAYACYGYYDPATGLWYYWYPAGNCYLPVSDMSTYPPVNDGSDPSLPPGATSGPSQ